MNHRMVSKSNIAAVEPYIHHNPQHSPVISTNSSNNNNIGSSLVGGGSGSGGSNLQQSVQPTPNNYYHKQMLQNMANLKLSADANGNTDDLKIAYIAMNENDDTAAYLLANKSHNKINSYSSSSGGGGIGGGVVGNHIGGANSNNSNNLHNNNNNINNISNNINNNTIHTNNMDALMGNYSTAKKFQTLPHNAKYNNHHMASYKENDGMVRMNGVGGIGDDMTTTTSTIAATTTTSSTISTQLNHQNQNPHQQHLTYQMSHQQLNVMTSSNGINGVSALVNGSDVLSSSASASPLPIDSSVTTTLTNENPNNSNNSNSSQNPMLLIEQKLRPALKEKSNIPTATALAKDNSNSLISSSRKPISSVAPTPISMVPKPVITTVSAKVNMVAPSINSSVMPIVSHAEVVEKTPALPPKPNKGPDTDASSSSATSSALSSPSSSSSSSPATGSKSILSPTSSIPIHTGSALMKLNSNNNNNDNRNGTMSQLPPPQQIVVNAVNAVNKANSATPPDTKSQTHTDYQFSMIGPTPNHDNLPIKAKPLTIKKQPLSEQPRLRSMLPSAKTNQFVSRRIEMPPSFLFPETEKLPSVPSVMKGDMVSQLPILKHTAATATSAVVTTNAVAPATVATTSSASTTLAAVTSTLATTTTPSTNVTMAIDEPDKATTHTTNEEDIVVPVSNLVKRTKSALSGEGGKPKVARRVSFDPLALLLDASLEGELELVQKTATQVNEHTLNEYLYIYMCL